MRKLLLLLWITLMLFPLVHAGEACKEIVSIGENCTIFTPSLSCSTNYLVYNATDLVKNDSMTSLESNLYYFPFTQSNQNGTYIIELCDNTTRRIIVQEDEQMLLAMIIGIGFIAALLIFVALMINNEHFLLRLMFFIVSLYLLYLIPAALINGALATADNLLIVMTRIVVFVSLYLLIYLIYYFLVRRVISWVKVGGK